MKTAQLLEKLVKTKYFRIIRLNIEEECSLGMMQKLCKSQSCTVCRCNEEDIP
jgi:ERO1-like protein alpha